MKKFGTLNFHLGEEEDHNFYNINAWEVDDTPKSFDVIYTITFTIYPSTGRKSDEVP